DKIIINVNFKKQEDHKIEECNEPKKDLKLDKSNTIETMSPEHSDDDSLLRNLSDDSISSPINFHFDHDKSKLSSSNLKDVFSGEFKFLSKITSNSEAVNNTKSNVVATKNVENRIGKLSDFDENDDIFINDDSFLPTPTQDESQSPVLISKTVTRTKQSSTSTIKSTGGFQSATATKIDKTKDSDFYDPELPLQSPDHSDHSKSPTMEKISFESTMKSSLLVSLNI
ncbi:hypothetical protein BLA29_007582, partial [Euroglyphus maynei]